MRGHLKQVGEGKYRLVVYAGRDADTGKKRQVWRTFHGTATAADEELQRLVTEVRDGVHSYAPGSVGDLLERWLRVAHLAPATRQDYRSVVKNYLGPTFGHVEVSRLRTSDLDAYYEQLTSQGLGPARIHRIHNVLAVALARAVTWREVASNVARDAQPPSVTRKEIRPPDTAEVVKVLEVARGVRPATVKRQRRKKGKAVEVEEPYVPRPALVAYIYLAAQTGARRSEVLGFQWDDIDFDAKTVTIGRSIVAVRGALLVEPTKTRRARRISLDSSTVMILRGHRAYCQQHAEDWGLELAGSSFLFHRDGDNTVPWRPDTTSDWFAEVRTAAGLPSLTIRQLRHYVATFLLGEGQDAVTVAGRLGHARPSTTTDIYAHFLPVKDRDAAETLGRALGVVEG